MKNRDFSIPITLGGQAYFLRHDYNSICSMQKTLGVPLNPEVFGTSLGMRATLFAMLGRVTRGKFVHLAALGEITLEECGDFFDVEPQEMILGKIAEAFKAARGDEADPVPNVAGLAKSGTGEVSSDLPADAV